MLNVVEAAPRQTLWRGLTRRAVGPTGRRLEPYAFLSPTLVILLILMLYPIGAVIRYSVMNNVILEKAPVFVGVANYVGILTSPDFWVAVRLPRLCSGLSSFSRGCSRSPLSRSCGGYCSTRTASSTTSCRGRG